MSWPKNAETIDARKTVITLDKTYFVRFTFGALFEVEKRFGTLSTALGELLKSPSAFFEFIAILINSDPKIIKMHLQPENLSKLLEDLFVMIGRDYPALKETDADKTDKSSEFTNWDEIYFTARYNLKMSNEEFWDCTPRRYSKLCDLFVKFNSLNKSEPEINKDPNAFLNALCGN
jgi:hypothetical protein